MTRSIYDKRNAPKEFVRCFIWWAYHKCINQQYTTASCGARFPVFTEAHLSPDCLERITNECNQFWREANSFIRTSKGRCNWHPAVDTDLNHVGNCGSNFFFARLGDTFFMTDWPSKEREKFVRSAKKFCPMFLRAVKNKLVFIEGHPPKRKPKD